MSNYTKSTNFATKDTLTSGDPLKIVKGTEINTEFDNIATAVNSKSDTASPTFTGTVTIPTASVSSTTDSSSTSTGSIITAGGIGVAKAAYIGTTLNVAGNTILGDASTDTLNVGNGGLVKDASGNVGIGTSSPSGANGRIFEVNGGAGQARLVLKNDATGSASTDGSQIALVGSQLVIQNREASEITFETNGSERMRIDSSGNLLVGNTSYGGITNSGGAIWCGVGGTGNSNTGFLGLNGSSASGYGALIGGYSNGSIGWFVGSYGTVVSGTNTYLAMRNSGGGGVYLNGASATAWTAVSDETRKVIIENITDAVNKVSTLRTVIGRLKTDDETVRRPYLIAQDVQAVLPEAVSEAEDKEGSVLGLAYTEVIPLIVAAIKEQQALITTLTDRITALENK